MITLARCVVKILILRIKFLLLCTTPQMSGMGLLVLAWEITILTINSCSHNWNKSRGEIFLQRWNCHAIQLFFHGFMKLLDSLQHVCFGRDPKLIFVIHFFQYVLTNRIHFRSLVQIIQHFFKMVNNLNTNLNHV